MLEHEELESVVPDFRLLQELKWKPKEQQETISDYQDDNGSIGNCVMCGRWGQEGIKCACTDLGAYVQVLMIPDRDLEMREYVHPKLWSQAMFEADGPQEAELHETGDFILGCDCQELTFTQMQHYEKDIMIRLSKLSHYEYLITKYHMDKGMGPAKLDWLDNLRQMTRREQQLMNEGMSQQEIATHFDLIAQAKGSWMVLPPYFIR